MIDCTVHLLISKAIEERESGRLLFSLLLKHFPTHAPQRYGAFQPLRKSVDALDPYSALDVWGSGQSYITERSAPNALMHVIFEGKTARRLHSSVGFIQFQIAKIQDLKKFDLLVRELSEVFEADYAMAHILTRAELADRLEDRRRRPTSWPEPPAEQIVAKLQEQVHKEGHALVLWRAEISRLHTVHLRKCLPTLYWLNVLGPPYVKLFRKERILETPAENVAALQYGGVAIRLTKDLLDSTEGWEKFKAVRGTCTEYLDSNVFFDSGASKDHQYRTPDFSFPESTEVR